MPQNVDICHSFGCMIGRTMNFPITFINYKVSHKLPGFI